MGPFQKRLEIQFRSYCNHTVAVQTSLKWNRRQGPACKVGGCCRPTWLPSRLLTPPANWQTLYAGTPPRTGSPTLPTPREGLCPTVCHIR